MTEQEQTDYVNKIVSFVPKTSTFVSDDGQTIEYSFFEITIILPSGDDYIFTTKTKSFADKVALLDIAQVVDK